METKLLEANKRIARQVFETISIGDFTKFANIVDSTKFKLHVAGRSEYLGFDEAIKMNEELRDSFPDLVINIEKQIAEGDFVLSRLVLGGTNKGDFQGISASGRKIRFTGMALQQIVNGKVIEEWDEFDMLGALRQLGAIHELEMLKK